MERLKKRPDFILASRSPYVWKRPSFVLQLRVNTGQESARVGFTVTKRQGNAVIRNCIKRRLREAVRLIPDGNLQSGCDYVIIGRKPAKEIPFADLQQELLDAIKRIHSKVAKI